MWCAKLKKMMDELPERYLQPEPVSSGAMMLIPPGSKPVSQLMEEEKKLNGVYNQLWDAACREAEAHSTLYGEDESKHPPEACRKFAEQMRPREDEMQLVLDIFAMSLKERLGFENEYIIDNYDVYAIPALDETLETLLKQRTGDDESTFNDMGIPGFRGWPEKES